MATTCSDPVVLAQLFLAAYSGELANVKSLLKNNGLSADVTDPSKGSTALLWASSGGSLKVVEWLIKQGGANPGHRNKDNRTAFFFACEYCHKPVASFLVSQGGVDVNAKDGPSGQTPLHRVCIAGQSRKAQTNATEMISWLLTTAKADPKVKDLRGNMPGDSDLAVEAPELKTPTARAPEITNTLAKARSGGGGAFSGGTQGSLAKTAAPPTPTHSVSGVSAPETAAEPRLLPKPSAFSSARPAMTLASARAAAVKSPSPTNRATAAARVAPPSPVSSPSRAAASSPSASRVALRAAALAEKSKVSVTVDTAKPAVVDCSTGTPTSPLSPSKASAAAAAAVKTRSPSPSSSPQKAPGLSSSSSSSSRSGAVPSPRSTSCEKSTTTRSLPSPSRARSPSSTDKTTPSWVSKNKQQAQSKPQSPRAGGVLPRAASGLRAPSASGTETAPGPGQVKHSFGLRSAASNGGGSASGSGSGSPPSANASAAATTIKPGLVKQSSYLLRKNSSLSNGTGSEGGSSVGPSTAPPAVTSRYQRPVSCSTAPVATTNAATGNAAAVIGASNGPKASAIRAAFENKAKGGAATGTGAPQRGNPVSLGAARAPELSTSPSGSVSSVTTSVTPPTAVESNGTPERTVASTNQRSSPVQPRPVSPTRVTPESLLGKGTVKQRTKVYTAAALKAGQSAPAPLLGKGKKEKDGSFMDKFVSMFSISPQSSPASSPQRSVSKSPRSKPRSPMATKVANWASSAANSSSPPPDGQNQPRLGFFNTNKSFKNSRDSSRGSAEKE